MKCIESGFKYKDFNLTEIAFCTTQERTFNTWGDVSDEMMLNVYYPSTSS